MTEPCPVNYESAVAKSLHEWYELQALKKGVPPHEEASSSDYYPPPATSPDYNAEFIVMEHDLPLGTTFSVYSSSEDGSVSSFEMAEPQRESRRRRRRFVSLLRTASKKTSRQIRGASHKTQQLERKHHVMEKTKQMTRRTSEKCKEAARGAVQRAREYNEHRQMTHKTTTVFRDTTSYLRSSFNAKRA